MTAKDYLNQGRWIDQRIESRIAERERLLDLVTSARAPQLSGMPRGGHHDWTDTVDAVVDMADGIAEDIRRMMALKREIWAVIDAVEDFRYRAILEMRYRSNWRWETIADQLHYDIRTVFRLHGEALRCVHVPQKMS